MTGAPRVRCLTEELGDYAAGRLDVTRTRAWDRHLVTCRVCADTVDQERRLHVAMAGAPSMPGDLRASLLALGGGLTGTGAAAQPLRRVDPLTLLSPSAPPCHRSALRATVVAAAAASASAAAALSLTVIGAPAARVAPVAVTAVPAVGTPGPTATPFSAVVVPTGWGRAGVAPISTRQAESTP